MGEDKRKRILVYGMSDNPGGMESYILYMMRHIDLNKYHFDMLTVFPKVAYVDELCSMGSSIYYADSFSRHPFRHISKVRKIMKNYDALYMNILDAGSFGTALAAKLAGKKVAVHSHNSDTDRPLLHKVSRPILNCLTDERYACSEIAGEHMFGQRSYKVIENCIDKQKFQFNRDKRIEYRKRLNIEDSFVICHVGRITKQKNPYGIINIFKEVKEKRRDAVLLYVGNGDMRQEIEAYIHKLNEENSELCLENSIRLLGVRDDVENIMSASDIFILPSIYEGFGIVAIEAQTNGLYCLLSDAVPRQVQIKREVVFLPIEEIKQWSNLIINAVKRK